VVSAKSAAPTPPKSATKSSVKASIQSVQVQNKAQPKPAAPAAPAKPVAPPAAPPKTKAGSRVVPSYAPSAANMSPHGGNTAAKASFTMSAPVFVPPPQLVIKKDAKLANNWKTKSTDQLSDAEVIAMPDSEYMNAKQLAFFRLKLVGLKNGILANAGETTEHLREDTSVVPDPADRATIEEEHALELRTRDRERKLLKKIEQSIASIDAEEYGYCDETGEPIGVARLIARPTATLSLEAQQRRELKQKMFGD
jgi:DnaK suppressor protein